MDKSPDAFRTISEVADWLGTPAHVLRFWESRFSQVKPVKRAGGRRYYRPSDMVLLGGIKKLLHDDGMTIRGVQKLLREHGVRYVASMSPRIEGVDPVEAPRESVGPVPAAPMAENVPTGAFDAVPEAPEERIIPFSRPDIPAQPAPNTSPPPAAVEAPIASAPVEAARPDVADLPPAPTRDAPDAPQAPMVDLDAPTAAPFEPRDPVEPPTPIEMIESPVPEAPTPNVAVMPDTIEAPVSEPITAGLEETPSAPAQVTFDFEFDAEIDTQEPSTAPPLVDDAAFETALQDALETPAIDFDAAELAPTIPEVSPEMVENSLERAQEHVSDSASPFEMNAIVPETIFEPASAAEDAPESILTSPDAENVSDDGISFDGAETESAFSDVIVQENIPAPPSAHDGGFETTDIIPPFEPVNDEVTDLALPDIELEISDETLASSSLADAPDFGIASSEQITDAPHDHSQTVPMQAIPDDLEDDATGLDVPEGVLGRLSKNALATADPLHVQAVFDRAMALKTKLSRAG
jgi:DNA-binding transcriptional MerR regulator